MLGRGHAEQLVPLIATLPARGRAERILVSLGPGSFTGVRIGIAAARALGLAWQARVLGYPTLALVAATARAQHPGPVTVCMTGGHGEWFVQDFAADGRSETSLASLSPAQALGRRSHRTIAGSRARELALAEEPRHAVLELLPDARFAPQLPAELFTDGVSPIYGRAPDARLPG